MKTFKHSGLTFVYNSDLSGAVLIGPTGQGHGTGIDGQALLAFVANYVRELKQSDLENASDVEVLGIAK